MKRLFAPLLFLFPLLFAPPVDARPADAVQVAARSIVEPNIPQHPTRPDPLIRRIQKFLAKIGAYQGPVDGFMGPRTEQAIRVFQQSRGLKADGRATESLLETLESDEKVDSLLKKLKTVRESRIQTARAALLADPRTRHLIERTEKDAVADPTRNVAPCFAAPTPQCLVTEAAESAKAIFKDELRDWALGEILSAQARAGLSDQAMVTARRISDPRLIMVALREIAEALASAGATREAMEAADVIPDADRRLDAYGAIAAIQTTLHGQGELNRVVKRILDLLKTAEQPTDTIKFRAQFATLYHTVGNNGASADHLKQAETQARRLPEDNQDTALRHIALARADLADAEGAMALLDKIKGTSDRTPVLTSAAKALARNGAAARALQTARNIEDARYRAVALSDVAGLLAHRGDTAAANEAIKDARALIDDIKLPYARSYAASRATMALLDVATASGEGFDSAIQAADTVEDPTLRAYTLWAISTEQRRSGDLENASFTETLAREAVDAIKSRLSRVWLYGDLAVGFSEAGETGPAWQAFNDGLAIAKGVTNAWARSRALAKLTLALSVLSEPETPHGIPVTLSIPKQPIPNGAHSRPEK